MGGDVQICRWSMYEWNKAFAHLHICTSSSFAHLQIRTFTHLLDQLILLSRFNGIGAGVDIQFKVDVFDMAAHGFQVDK